MAGLFDMADRRHVGWLNVTDLQVMSPLSATGALLVGLAGAIDVHMAIGLIVSSATRHPFRRPEVPAVSFEE